MVTGLQRRVGGWTSAALTLACFQLAHGFCPPTIVSKSHEASGGGSNTRKVTTALRTAGFDIGEWLRQAFYPSPQPKDTSPTVQEKAGRDCSDAVLVLGGTGKTGQYVVKALLDEGRSVVVAARSEEKAKELFGATSSGLYIQGDVDVTNEAALRNESLFEGVSQVVSAIGPRFGEEGSTAEAIDYKGNVAALTALQHMLYPGEKRGISSDVEDVLINNGSDNETDATNGPGGKWERLDDVIMGGQSSSGWKAGVGRGVLERQSGEAFGRWAGTLVEEGGGFCGTVIKDMPFDVGGYDGIRLRVRGDGNRYKFRLKPATEEDAAPERQYQASFDTVKGTWIEVDIPFESFVAVKRNFVDYSAPGVNKGPAGGKMSSLGIVLSRFLFNEFANPVYSPGPFQLDLKNISLYRKPRPDFVMISSAASERYQRLSDEERAKDIPIVALNPGGILNWKYKGETSLRTSKLRHCIIRATGLLQEGKDEDVPVRLAVGQGDVISGRISRKEVARAVVAALGSPYAHGKTFELRRDEAEDACGKEPNFPSLFRSLVPDDDRVLATATGVGLPLPPFPIAQDPPPPVPEERKQEILNDPRVKARNAQEA